MPYRNTATLPNITPTICIAFTFFFLFSRLAIALSLRSSYMVLYTANYIHLSQGLTFQVHISGILRFLWISRKAQNYRKASMMIWIDMAVRSTIQKCTHIVYGTNVKMLACVYAQPSESILLHSDHINGKKTWTFYGKKSCMLKSVFGILKSRWSR